VSFLPVRVIPWGNGTLSAAVDDALEKVKGDALINVTVSNSLYGFLPIYNIFAFTCTDVKGIAITKVARETYPACKAGFTVSRKIGNFLNPFQNTILCRSQNRLF